MSTRGHQCALLNWDVLFRGYPRELALSWGREEQVATKSPMPADTASVLLCLPAVPQALGSWHGAELPGPVSAKGLQWGELGRCL